MGGHVETMYAGGGKLVDTSALGADAARRGGSSPLSGTSTKRQGMSLAFCIANINKTLMVSIVFAHFLALI